jgi:hypothetical protein
MSSINLKATETKILADAAAQDGRIVFPARIKESTRQRLVGLLTGHELVHPGQDESELQLTTAGYRAVGLEPPQTADLNEKRGLKKDLVRQLLERAEGASLGELVAATGWLPHTTRAALCRLRKEPAELAKSKREDGTTVYRLGPAVALEAAA